MKALATLVLLSATSLLRAPSALAAIIDQNPFPLQVFLNEENVTTGYTAPGRIQVDLTNTDPQPGSVVLCEKLSADGLSCVGFMSDVVIFTRGAGKSASATLHSDIAGETGPTEALPLPLGDDGDLSFFAGDPFIQESNTGVTEYIPHAGQPGFSRNTDLQGNPITQLIYEISSDAPAPELPEPATAFLVGVVLMGAMVLGGVRRLWGGS